MNWLKYWWNNILYRCRHDEIGNPRESGDLWVFCWMMVCLFTILGLMVAVIYGVLFGVLR